MTASEDQAIVLHYAPDNASLIVRLLLEELGVAYEAKLVDRRNDAQNSAEYLKLNPNGVIPVCIINGAPVFETGAILLSLADRLGQFSVPLGHRARPQFLKWLFFLSNSLHSDLRQRFYPEKYAGENTQALQLFTDITLARLHQRFSIVNQAYSDSSEPYLFDKQPSIIDLYLAVCFRWAQLYPLALKADFNAAKFTAIIAMVEQLEQRPLIRQGCVKEGITGRFFSQPGYSKPLEGVAL